MRSGAGVGDRAADEEPPVAEAALTQRGRRVDESSRVAARRRLGVDLDASGSGLRREDPVKVLAPVGVRRGILCRLFPHGREVVVEPNGTAGEVDVVVTGDDVERDDRARRVLGCVASRRAQLRPPLRVAAMQTQLPPEHPADLAEHPAGWGGRGEVPDRRDAERVGVEPSGLGTDDRPVGTAGATFEDLPVAVDEELVAHVAHPRSCK
jgi:hypothetical protein